MPIFEIACRQCGRRGEVLVICDDTPLACPHCGSAETDKLMSVTSSMTGRAVQPLPGPGDTTCCGSNPAQTQCAGPGSCCGKA
jgi:putative FmdB family regulatory protein